MLISSDSNPSSSGSHQEAEQFIQSALDALAAHIAILDKKGRIITVNAAWRDFADENGLTSPNYGIGLNYLKVCETSRAGQDAALMATGIRDIMNGHLNEFELEYPCHSPTQRRWFVARISRFDWHHETRLIIAHQNITELKRVQLDLAGSKRRTEAILENVNNGIITFDQSGNIETANPVAARIFGYDQSDMATLHVSRLLAEPFAGSATFRQLMGSEGHEIVGVRYDGSHFPIYLAMNELRLSDGVVYTCIIKDITLRKRMEAERLEREKLQVALDKEREIRELKNRFLSMMSHELRTPLASIRLSYDMLRKYAQVSTSEERDQALENINAQVEFLADMVSDVLTISRSDSDSFAPILQDTDLITYCRDVVEEFQFNYVRTHQIEFECDQRTLRAPVDRKLMRRALTNLITNAIKYSPTGGRIDFTLTQVADNAIITVSDSGIGIPMEDQSRLFEPFHRASNVTNITGTGLGLPITKQAIELHNGSIEFVSGANGTTFTIRLPLNHD